MDEHRPAGEAGPSPTAGARPGAVPITGEGVADGPPTVAVTEVRVDDGDDGGPPRRAVVLALVALVVVVGAAGVWLASGDDGKDDGGAAGRGTGGGAAAADPWGRRWEIRWIIQVGSTQVRGLHTGPVKVLDLTEVGRVSFQGCNSASATGRIEGDRLVVEEISQTEMACTGPDGEALMAYDAWMSEFLSSRPEVSVDGDQLTLSSPSGTVLASDAGGDAGGTTVPGRPDDPVSSPTMPRDPDDPTLPDPGSGTVPEGPLPVEPDGGAGGPLGGDGGGSQGSPGVAALWGSRWEIVGIDGSAPVPARDGGAPVLDTEVEDRVAYTGCNGGGADASVDGDRLLVGDVLSTKLACAGPEGEALMAQDVRLADILGSRPTVAVEGDRLTITGADGAIEAVRR